MKLSLVIPLYNKAPYIGETIASVAAQDELPNEVIIVDDASTDGSLDQLRQTLSFYAHELRNVPVQIVNSERNSGPGTARNLGIERATGDIIAFLDADDRYRSDALRLIRLAMGKHQLAMLVLGFATTPPAESFPSLPELDVDYTRLGNDLCLLSDPLHAVSQQGFYMGRASNVAVNRKSLAHHRYCTTSRLNEGVDLWYRVLKDVASVPNGRVGLLDAPLISFRVLQSSLSHSLTDDWRALPVPPTLARFIDSTEDSDQRMCRMLGQRWFEHAMAVLPDSEKCQFLTHQQGLLTRLGLSLETRKATEV